MNPNSNNPHITVFTPPRGQRYVTNPYHDTDTLNSLEFGVKEAQELMVPLLAELDRGYEHRFLMSSTRAPLTDQSVYTGLGGIALTYLKLAQRERLGGNQPSATHYLRRAQELALSSLADVQFVKKENTVSFFVGVPGCLAMACVTAALLGETSLSQTLWDKLLTWESRAVHAKEDELLFGRAGYLYALLFVQTTLQRHKDAFHPIDENALNGVMKRVAEKKLASGRATSKKHGYDKDGWPLMFHCFHEPYLGAAHGMVGILKMLYHCWHILSPDEKNCVRQTTQKLLECRFPSGNLPAVLGDTKDKLVHWCHGSPGLPSLAATALEVDGDASGALRSAALQAGEHIWKYGILLKGNGLCHGIAGNAYAFLSLYQLTNDTMHLQKAKAFANLLHNSHVQKFISHQPDRQRRVMGTPDSPQSLMEGSAGVLCFLLDMMQPETAKLPGWDL